MACATVHLNFNVLLEKAKLKDDGSNYTDSVRNLRIILIAAQKNYVLDAPLCDRPIAGADADVMKFGKLVMMSTWYFSAPCFMA